MNTKGLNIEQIDKYVRMLRMEHREGRADLAPELCELIHREHCDRYNSTNKKVTKRVKFENVKVEDRHNIHPFAVKEIVRVKDPRPDCHLCGSPGFVFIEICVPPHCKPEIDIKRKDGSKIEYDYGDYEVEITSKNGYVKVDYDD